jgi:hypothetical protein
MLPQELYNVSFINPTFTVGQQLINLWLPKVILGYVNGGVMVIKPGHQTSGNAWYGHISCPSRCSIHQEKFTLGGHPRKPGSNTETRGRFCGGFGRNVMVKKRSVFPIITLYGRITLKEYLYRLGNQVYPEIQTLLPDNDTVFQDNVPWTQLELFDHGLKMMVNFNIFSGQHNLKILTSLKRSGQFWRPE